MSVALVDANSTRAVEGVGPEIIIALSPEDAAKAYGVDRGTIYKMLNDGRLPSFHVGRARRIPVAALREYAEANTEWAR